MSKSQGKERRAHERHDTQLDIQGSPDQGGVVARMVARNLSLGGLHCTSTADFPEMSRLAVRLMLPLENGSPREGNGLEPVDLEAVVVRREETGSGSRPRFDLALYFTNMDEMTREQIRRYLDQRAS